MLLLPEVVTVDSLPALLKKTPLQKLPVAIVDCSDLSQADSALMALLMKWSSQSGKPVQLKSFPQFLENLVDLYQMEHLIERI